ncbi:MAG TPA: hypothetical protein VF446_11935 [Trinickia sp.]
MTVSEVAAPLRTAHAPVTSLRPKRSRRATSIKWLCDVHGWVGLWGGVPLWTRLHRRKTLVAALLPGSVGLADWAGSA